MSVFSAKSFRNHEQVLFHCDPASGLRAIIAIHDTTLGPALGGCRYWTYDDAALDDVLRLSRGMTYKAALAKLCVPPFPTVCYCRGTHPAPCLSSGGTA